MMTSNRIREIQKETAYPCSVSVKQALLQVWNEYAQSVELTQLKADNERLKDTLNKLHEQDMCSHAGDELIKEVLLITNP
jgi:hypothetical protein